MTRTAASRIATSEISLPYRTAARLRSGTTWGFSIRTPRGTWEASIGSYADAATARAVAVQERIADLLDT